MNLDKERISELESQIAINQSDMSLLKRRLADGQDEERRYKQETQHLISEIQRVSSELENEMKQRLMLETDKQGLEEQLIFMREMHSKEVEAIKEKALRQVGLDPSQYFKSELANAIRGIREEFEALGSNQRSELDVWFRLKVVISSFIGSYLSFKLF